MPHSKNKQSRSSRRRSPAYPRCRGANIRNQWSVRRFRTGSLNGPAYAEFKFPTEGKKVSQLCLPYSELRHVKKMLDEFADYLPVFPPDVEGTDAGRNRFIQDLVSSHSGPLELVPERTGFIDEGTFVTYSEIIHADGKRDSRPRLGGMDTDELVDLRGTSQGAKEALKLARYSTYLAFGIGVALASPLPNYVKIRGQGTDGTEGLVAETAVFNFSGESSGGKSSVCLAAISLAGSPDRAGTLDFSRRGLAEMASESNDLLLVLDDTEKAEDGPGALVKALKSMVHMVPGGRSKAISRGVDQDRFPQLRWSTFGLSSSPQAIPKIAAQSRWAMSPGDKVRLFDIAVPGPGRGGIFDRIAGGPALRRKRSVNLIDELQRGYTSHNGHIIPLWVLYLMAKDRSKQITGLVRSFIDRVEARHHGWELRFAQKFGVIYAAMKIGINAGILPWPKTLPLTVATKCYRKARHAAKTAYERAADAAAKLEHLIAQPGRMVDGPSGRRRIKPIKITDRTVAIRYTRDGRLKLGVLDRALLKLLGSKNAKTIFTKELAAAGLVSNGHGHAGTIQERISIERDGQVINRPRLWVIDVARFLGFLKKTSLK